MYCVNWRTPRRVKRSGFAGFGGDSGLCRTMFKREFKVRARRKGMQDVLIIGNNLDETAYHEAGHIVVATVLELDLRPKGITIWEAAPNVMDGLAGYWNHDTDWEKNLQAVRAGQIAQWTKFPNTDTTGSKPDNDSFFRVAKERFPETVASNLWENTSKEAHALLRLHWAVVIAIAETLITAEWLSVPEIEHPLAKRKKHLDGKQLVQLLAKHGISARVRHPVQSPSSILDLQSPPQP
jgi:hypothetical protein